MAGITIGAGAHQPLDRLTLTLRELRRITRPGGHVLVVLNGEDHLRELRDLITVALQKVRNGGTRLAR